MWPGRSRRFKFGNVPTRSAHTGRLFQSKKEARREPALLAMQYAGLISNLRYQVSYKIEVFGTQAVEALLAAIEAGDPDDVERRATDVFRSRQKICRYVADFVYEQDGESVVEDVKGYITPEYRLKKKLMVAAHNIEIVEPTASGVEQRARGAGVKGARTGSRFKGGS